MSLLESEGFARSDRLVGGDWIPPSVVPKPAATGRDEWKRTVALDELLPAGMSDEGNRRTQDRRRREIMHKR